MSVILRYQDGVYTTDYDNEREETTEEIILLPLVSDLVERRSRRHLTIQQGILLEKFLTLGKRDFQKYLKTYTKGDHPSLKDVHRYAKVCGATTMHGLDRLNEATM